MLFKYIELSFSGNKWGRAGICALLTGVLFSTWLIRPPKISAEIFLFFFLIIPFYPSTYLSINLLRIEFPDPLEYIS